MIAAATALEHQRTISIERIKEFRHGNLAG
jgi:hypothetical protein